MAGNNNSYILAQRHFECSWGFQLITSEIENFVARNFVTFPEIKCRIRPTLKIFEISNLGYVTWPYLVSRHGKQAKIWRICITRD